MIIFILPLVFFAVFIILEIYISTIADESH